MNKFSIKFKMIAVCLSITFLGLISGVVGYVSVNNVSGHYHPIATKELPLILTLGDMRGDFRELRIQIRSIAFMGTTPADVDKYVGGAMKELAKVDALFEKYEKIDSDEGSRKSFQDLKTSWEEFKKFGGELVEKSKNYEANQTEIVRLIRDVCPIKAEKVYEYLQAETDIHLKNTEEATQLAVTSEGQAKFLTILFSCIAVLVALCVSYIFAQRLSTNVSKISLRLAESGGQVRSAVEQLSLAGNQMSGSASQSAASLEETVASLEELNSMVKMNSDNAKQAASLSVTSKESAESGEREIKKLITSMNEISQSSKKIEEIIHVIDDIAFQTNLLALNAAVEAARAGEQGKGFAVVAEAVRSLAQRSAVAAKDITTLIKDSVEKISLGTRIADQSGSALNAIVSSVKKVSDLNNEISAASSEQAVGIEQISRAMNQLDQGAQSNAATAEEVAATSQTISELAGESHAVTLELNNLISGGSTSFQRAA